MTWINLILTLLPVAVGAIPSLGAEMKQIIGDVAGSLSALVASGVIQQTNASTVLNALAGVLAALQAEPNIPPETLKLIQALTRAAQAATAADTAAQQKVDPTTLQPITPIS